MDERFKSPQTLFNAEERGEIPKATRNPRGKIQVRFWKTEQLPAIGARFGFLQKNTTQKILCKYIQKGGVLKTTSSFNEARILALNGIKTLVIGLDFECSITDIILPKALEAVKLDKLQQPLGLYQFFAENAPIEDVIVKTSLPTLDIIPETHDLVALDKWINQQTKREYIFANRLLDKLSSYDVIIFDNGPSWNHLIENSISCSDTIISPLGCNLLAYNASTTNFSSLLEFQEAMLIKDQKLIMFPTLLDRSSLSQQIYGQYLTKFTDYVLPIPIRFATKGQESLLDRESIFEHAPNSPIAQDYYDLIRAMWDIINNKRISGKNTTDPQEVPKEIV
jgi:chromosome partitioning protein